tara:strand:- start:930 stop:2525 length:1596 start_codon:yes stop_codon:yes gene_type:complete
MDIYINTDRPVDRSIVAGINQPQREAPVGAFVAGSSYDTNIYFVRNDGSFDPASGSVSADVQIAISTISDPVSGSYTLTDGSAITGDIVYGSSSKIVQDALNALNGGAGPSLGSPGLVDVVKNSDTQYTITFRTFGAKTALNGNTVSLYPESTPTGSIAVNGSATEYAQQVIEIVRQPAIYQQTWTTITNGFNATLSLNTTRLLQSLVVDQGQPFFIEVKLNGETVSREVVGMELSTMPASAFSGVAIKSLLDEFAADPLTNSYFDAVAWGNALSVAIGAVTSVNAQTGAVLVATVAQGALADTALQASDIGTTVQAQDSILDNTTASFTTAQENKLTAITGTNTGDQDLSGLQNILLEGAFIDGDKLKLDGIEAGATTDQTGAEIKAAYELEASAFTDPQFTKLAGVETGAQVNIDLFGFALSDEETALTTDNGIIVDMPHDLTIKRVYASLRTAGTTSATVVEVLDGVTAVLDSSLSITAATTNAETSLFSGAAASYTMSKGDKLTIQVTAVDSAGIDAGIKVFLEGTR